MQKVYFHKDSKLQSVIDLSGKKSPEQIKGEFGDFDYQVLGIDENREGQKIEDDRIKKYDLAAEKQQIQAEKETEKKTLADKLKAKFGFSDKDFEDLKKIIR